MQGIHYRRTSFGSVTMQLHVDFDDDLIRRCVERGRSPLFTIYWTQDHMAYPEDGWLDFGSAVLSWWLASTQSLLGGVTEAELRFMDGPFCLRASLVGDLLYVTADDQPWQWRTPMAAFVSGLLRATEQVQRKLDELGISDEEGLQAGARSLKTALSNLDTKAISGRSSVVAHVA